MSVFFLPYIHHEVLVHGARCVYENMRANVVDVWYAIQIYVDGNTIPPSFTALEQ